jgi:hypothetical protein
MTRRALLPQIDACIASPPNKVNRRPVSRRQLLQAVYPFVVITILGLIHVHLHLLQTDLLVQTGHLQKEQRNLIHDVSRLERQTESLCNTSHLKSVARALNMEPLQQISSQVYAMVPARVAAKYSEPVTDGIESTMVAQADKRSGDKGVWHVLTNLFDTGKAVASAVRD